MIKQCIKCATDYPTRHSRQRYCSLLCWATKSIEERFWNKIVKSDTCWIWMGQITDDGYGCAFDKGKEIKAHRLSYELNVGPIPDGLEIDHTCHTCKNCKGGVTCRHRRCVNPDHLEPVTRVENVRRGVSFSAVNSRKTHCKRGHPLCAENVYFYNNGRYRSCRTCALDKAHKRYVPHPKIQ